ncbi:hypothetical protein LSAT2_027990 [Lamellibrachia satsuma]|nr:hypothetical protein LSAT2_027990 [Lamellibrachia satsuma]
MTNRHMEKDNSGSEVPQKKGLRLSPEEQDLAYQWKANMVRRLQHQNVALASELGMHATIREVRRKQKQADQSVKKYHEEKVSRVNAVKLMRMYEKRAKEADTRKQHLEMELDKTKNIAQRYRRLYLEAKEKTQTLSMKVQRLQNSDSEMETTVEDSSFESEKYDAEAKTKVKVTEDDLDDDEARIKRHLARIRETKAMLTTSCNIRVVDIIRKNETLLMQNASLRQEVQRLRKDNTELVRTTKHAMEHRQHLVNTVHTSEMARRELRKKLDIRIQQYQQVQHCITRQTASCVKNRQYLQQSEEVDKCNNVARVSVLAAQERTYMHPVRKNVHDPRSMFPAKCYAKPELAN